MFGQPKCAKYLYDGQVKWKKTVFYPAEKQVSPINKLQPLSYQLTSNVTPRLHLTHLIIIIIIKSHRSSRLIRPPHCLTNTFCLVARFGYLPALPPGFFFFDSFLTVLLQVVFGLPLALRPSGVYPNGVKQSLSPSLLSMWPSQFHLLRRTSQLMSLISANSTTLLFVILCCPLICSIRLSWFSFLFL